MARGRKTAITVSLTSDQRDALESWLRSTTIAAGLARRARVILGIADRQSVSDITRSVPISRRLVYKWIKRFLDKGIDGLRDAPRSGRPPEFSPRSRRVRRQDRLRAA